MYKPKFEKEIRCPLEYGLSLFGGKWKSRIICVLAHKGILRYGELKNEIVNITDTVLAQNIKELINEDIVMRIQYDEIPPRVEYHLTDKGLSVVPILQNICSWSGGYFKKEGSYPMEQCRKCEYHK